MQCEKRLHQEVHHPERDEGSDSSAQIIEQGKRIGELACQQYPNGILIDKNPLSAALRKTAELLESELPSPL